MPLTDTQKKPLDDYAALGDREDEPVFVGREDLFALAENASCMVGKVGGHSLMQEMIRRGAAMPDRMDRGCGRPIDSFAIWMKKGRKHAFRKPFPKVTGAKPRNAGKFLPSP